MTADQQASGGIRVALEAETGAASSEIMATVGKAVTEAALARHSGRVANALQELRMSKGTWYRIGRGE